MRRNANGGSSRVAAETADGLAQKSDGWRPHDAAVSVAVKFALCGKTGRTVAETVAQASALTGAQPSSAATVVLVEKSASVLASALPYARLASVVYEVAPFGRARSCRVATPSRRPVLARLKEGVVGATPALLGGDIEVPRLSVV